MGSGSASKVLKCDGRTLILDYSETPDVISSTRLEWNGRIVQNPQTGQLFFVSENTHRTIVAESDEALHMYECEAHKRLER